MKFAIKLPSLVCSTFLFICCLLPSALVAQIPGCGTDEVQQELLKRNPAFQQKQKEVESTTFKTLQKQYKNKGSLTKSTACGGDEEEIYRVPIVVHVMHLPEDSIPGMGSNLSDTQIQDGIDHLNEAFRNEGSYAGGPYHTSATSYGVQSEDVKIQFVLAKRDPSGNSSNGINRISTSYSNLAYADDGPTGGTQDSYLKSLSFWNSNDYTNVWLVNEICKYEPDSICGVAGYAYLAGAHGASYDGIVNEGRYWGSSTNASKVHIHEVGHYLNLYHTFNDPDGTGSKTGCDNGDCLQDGDYVCDTPPDNSTSAVSCNSSNTTNSCSSDADDTSSNNPFTTDVDDMYENYMDYGYQSCQNTFTQGQKDRMRLALTSIRASLLSSPGLTAPNVADAEIASILSPSSEVGCASFTPSISLNSRGDITLTSAKIAVSLDGVLDHVETWSGNLTSGNSESVVLSAITSSTGNHNLLVYLTEINGSSTDADAFNDTASLCFNVYSPSNNLPYCEDFEASSGTPAHWAENNPSGTDLWAVYDAGTGCSSENGNKAFYLDNWTNFYGASGADIDLFLASIDLSGLTDIKLSFAHAYARTFSSRKLEMDIAISTDCGASFQSLQSWDDTELATTSSFEYTHGWEPTSCDDWANDTLDLSAFAGETVLVRFRAQVQAYYAQNLYLDNICLTGNTNTTCQGLNISIDHQDETCSQGDGSATAQVSGGTAPYVYFWDTTPFQTTATATNLSAGIYELIVTDATGCGDTTEVQIENSGSLPDAGFTKQTQGLNLTVGNTSTSDLRASYVWDFGDGNTSTDDAPSHTYASPGNYTICLTVSNTCGSDSICHQITVTCPEPSASFGFGINKLAVSMVNNSSDADTYSWNFGDGNTSTEVNPTHNYAMAGTYTACLISSNSCGADTSCSSITVDCPYPVSEFSVSPDELDLTFNNDSEEAESYSWDFGDGNTSTLASPSHTYAAQGSYDVCLISTNMCGADTACISITITCTDPVSDFTYEANNLAHTFTDKSSDASEYFWDFGDGNSSNEVNPSHMYADTGSYEVCLIVMNACGADTLCQTIEVICPEPIAAFTPDASGLNMIFIDKSENAKAYSWDFGDGSSSKLPRPFYTYDLPGTYTVCQTVFNDCGEDVICQDVTVSCPGPKSQFTFSTEDLEVTFSSTSSTGATYAWDFGDGNTSKEYAPTHTYDSSGVYQVNLVVSTICGVDTASAEIQLDETTSIAPESLLSARVYPNPSTGIFYVELEELVGEEITLEVYDIRGKVTLTKKLNSFSNKSKEMIDLTDQPKGIYFLSLRADSKQFIQKLSLKQ